MCLCFSFSCMKRTFLCQRDQNVSVKATCRRQFTFNDLYGPYPWQWYSYTSFWRMTLCHSIFLVLLYLALLCLTIISCRPALFRRGNKSREWIQWKSDMGRNLRGVEKGEKCSQRVLDEREFIFKIKYQPTGKNKSL